MNIVGPEGDGPLDESWTAPLDHLAAIARNDPRYQFFDVADMMIMCKIVRSSRPDVIEYKHYFTRRTIHLDVDACPYRYVPPREGAKGDGRFVVHKDILRALDQLDTWELPWMKPELEKYRFGRTWDERWDLHPDFDPRIDRRREQYDYNGEESPEDDWVPPERPTTPTVEAPKTRNRRGGQLRLV